MDTWERFALLEGFASATSTYPGEAISFHFRTTLPIYSFRILIYQIGKVRTLVWTSAYVSVRPYSTPEDAYQSGCPAWPAAITLTIPDQWSSGVYVAYVDGAPRPYDEIFFVVKAKRPGVNSKIVFQLAVNTYQAYNCWKGKSLYGFNSSGDKEIPADKVSFNRPLFSTQNFPTWEEPFVKWLEENNFEVEYCTNVDLHAERDFLDNYRLLLSVGHDEYWSKEMRDNVEAFIGNGGNVAFFSGNVCWWQVRFEDNNRRMVCYRYAKAEQIYPPEAQAYELLDPLANSDTARATVNWYNDPVFRPENHMTGVSYRKGAFWDGKFVDSAQDENFPRPFIGYRVRQPEHWIFDGTGLQLNDEFGRTAPIVGYETDAADFRQVVGSAPEATGRDGSPRNFLILALADLRDWHGQPGWATMGSYRSNGIVFTAATTDWSAGLGEDPVSQITKNVLRRLGCPSQSEVLLNRGFEKWKKVRRENRRIDLADNWALEGPGTTQPSSDKMNGKLALLIDANRGDTSVTQTPLTWLSHSPTGLAGRSHYRLGCFAKTDKRGVSIRLQFEPRRPLRPQPPDAPSATPTGWQDFAVSEHSGSGKWEYLCAVGRVDDQGPMFNARVRLQVAAGADAWFDDVLLDAL